MFYILGTHNYIFHAKHGNSKLRNVHLKVKKKSFFYEVMSHLGLGRMMMIMFIVQDEDGDEGE